LQRRYYRVVSRYGVGKGRILLFFLLTNTHEGDDRVCDFVLIYRRC
jgi:hypothetical protein